MFKKKGKTVKIGFCLFMVFIIISYVFIQPSENPIHKIKRLKNNLSSLSDAQVYDELMEMKRTIKDDYKYYSSLKETTLDEIGTMYSIKSVLDLIDPKKDKRIDCSSLKNSLFLGYKEEWDEMDDGVLLTWSIVERCCKNDDHKKQALTEVSDPYEQE